jgi:glycosyltransferase involved in cell wall biosynthesis
MRPSTVVERLVIGKRPGESGKGLPAYRLLGDYCRFARRVASGRYDVIHLNPSLTVKSTLRDAVFLAILRLMRRRNVLVFVHGWRLPIAERIARSPVRRRIFRWLFQDVARVLVLAEPFRDSLVALGLPADRIQVSTTAFDGAGLSRAIAGRDGGGAGARSILFLSRLAREKGVHELLEAFSTIVPRYPDSVLILAGDGPDREAISHRVAELGLEDRVRLPGYVRGRKKAELLAAARIFVLPSYTEGLPLALLEAMGAGAAVVASNTGGIGDVVSVPRNGLLIDEVTPYAIAQAIDRLLADDDYCRHVGHTNRDEAWRLYEAKVVATELENTYRSIAGAEPR